MYSNRPTDDAVFQHSERMLGAANEWADQVLTVDETATILDVRGDKVVMDALDMHFAYNPEGYWRAESYQRWRESDGKKGWDGYIRPLKRRLHTRGIIQRGHLAEIQDWCLKSRVKIVGKVLPRPFEHVTADDIP